MEIKATKRIRKDFFINCIICDNKFRVCNSQKNLLKTCSKECRFKHRSNISKSTPRTPEWKAKIGKSNKGLLLGRTTSEKQKETARKMRGVLHPNYNPEKENFKKVRKFCYQSVYRVLLKNDLEKPSSTYKILGYNAKELKENIESKFKDGMNWNNKKLWHIDHIKPIHQFLKEGVTDLSIINSLNNLQPLWAKDNLKKGRKFLTTNNN